MSLKGLITVVAGGTGIVGSGIVSQLVQNGAKCWIPSRDETRFNELAKSIPNQFHSNLAFVKADLSKENEGIKLRDEILKKDGKINHVVSSIGGGWRTDGKLSTLSLETYQKVLIDYTLPHLVCYKSFANVLSQSPKSSYIFVTGGSCEAKVFDPRASLLPPTTGVHYGFVTSANSEFNRHKNLSIMELRIFTWVRREPDVKFEQKKSEIELGNDFVGKFIPKLILKNKSDIYKLPSRSVANQLYTKL